MKRLATKKTVDEFIKIVYPNMTELHMSILGEEDILKEATKLIKLYRKSNRMESKK